MVVYISMIITLPFYNTVLKCFKNIHFRRTVKIMTHGKSQVYSAQVHCTKVPSVHAFYEPIGLVGSR